MALSQQSSSSWRVSGPVVAAATGSKETLAPLREADLFFHSFSRPEAGEGNPPAVAGGEPVRRHVPGAGWTGPESFSLESYVKTPDPGPSD
jgi:hypothetical protein